MGVGGHHPQNFGEKKKSQKEKLAAGQATHFQGLMKDWSVIQVEYEFYLLMHPERSRYIFLF